MTYIKKLLLLQLFIYEECDESVFSAETHVCNVFDLSANILKLNPHVPTSFDVK